MPGNFYSEPLKDEVKRLRAELSRERALCAGLAKALRAIVSFDRVEPRGSHCDFEDSVPANDGPFAKLARVALSELEKQA